MKKVVALVVCLMMVLSYISLAEQDDEKTKILFRGLPWRARYSYVKTYLSDLRLLDFRGETVHPYQEIDIITDQWNGKKPYEYTDINIFAYATKQTMVAGYPTSNIYLHFVYIPENGVASHSEDRAALYGATYEFELEDIDAAYEDLGNKLTSLYGNRFEEEFFFNNFFGYDSQFWMWEDHIEACVILGKKYALDDTGKNKVWISYVCGYGDEYLQSASDAEKRAQEATEQEAVESGDKSGL